MWFLTGFNQNNSKPNGHGMMNCKTNSNSCELSAGVKNDGLTGGIITPPQQSQRLNLFH